MKRTISHRLAHLALHWKQIVAHAARLGLVATAYSIGARQMVFNTVTGGVHY
jgi:hypothetical protein